eukprot:CAMPEP_0195524518 /NCGR_PEP_ID=MMETSP0794_2-20130614/24410_1 /TAXON_ID=515487 /ORGANISM="Stephanopyxis turris, Strain CCMP 815" /LENGTH=106 /DNA_ID=CAMNT_0040654761 /DNA_START=146 /DNA_END=466 /DNA_ORIENTATION=+
MAVTSLDEEGSVGKFTTENSKTVLYFTATWCPPCKAIKPIYDELSDKYPDVSFGKVDVDANADAAMEFEIRSVPTFALFNGDSPFEKFAGADSDKLEKSILKLNDA